MNQNNIEQRINDVIQRTLETSSKDIWPAIYEARQFLYQEFNIEPDHSNEYWVSVLIQNDSDKRAWLLSTNSSVSSMEDAIKIISDIRKNHKTLAAWVDTFTEDSTSGKVTKKTVYHDYFVDCFGNVR